MKSNLSLILATILFTFAVACDRGPNQNATLMPTISDSASPTPTPTAVEIPSPTATPFPTTTPIVETDLTGNYTVAGKNPNGTSYSGDASITRNDPWYDMVWIIGQEKFTGFGMINGQVLSVRWIGPDCQGYGTVTYTLLADGALVGTWTIDGQEGKGTEILTPVH